MEGTESKLVGRGCSVVVGVAGSRSLSMDAPLFVERDAVRNDGVDAHLWLLPAKFSRFRLPGVTRRGIR